jgi:hypothetical protein
MQASTYFVVEHLVLLLHRRQKCVSREVVGPAEVLMPGSRGLLLEGVHPGRQEASEVECTPFIGRERGALVEDRVVEQLGSRELTLDGA